MNSKLLTFIDTKIKLLEQAANRAAARKERSCVSLRVTERGGIIIDRSEILESRNFRAAKAACEAMKLED